MKFTEEEKKKLINKHIEYGYENINTIIAQQGYGLDKLINDESNEIRQEVARHKVGLDILINDEDKNVRCEVARQGYGLDILINDDNDIVSRYTDVEMATKYPRSTVTIRYYDNGRRNYTEKILEQSESIPNDKIKEWTLASLTENESKLLDSEIM